MGDQIILLLAGFILTTVLGGILGYLLQNRSWEHQNNVRLLEAELQASLKVFEETSRLMDKRLYSMRMLFWRLNDVNSDQETIEKYMELYRAVLYEWNENLNRNLALIQCYFVPELRDQMDFYIYEEFKSIGVLLEEGYRKRISGQLLADFSDVEAKVNALSFVAYKFNIRMIEAIQQNKVGLNNKEAVQERQNKRQLQEN